MFGLFKKKTQTEKLQEQYTKLLKEAHALSTSNRKLSDQKIYEANEILNQIEALSEK
ncbi:Lacal_2735 family protein [Tenacibaculum sp. SG-28]|uniref:Lacal_2735 family protein n=1 Tax=Tenacibaculum sp. SG-28 TaxID=754426 RepID=UPI000CF4C21E|nr:Lacal_2735 family protein [Tenacibaculum sp. SG-28]